MWQAELLNTVFGSLSVGVTPSTSSYESIATVTVGSGGAADITFSSIPSTYKHLQIRLFGRVNGSVTTNGTKLQLNTDTGSNYTYHTLFGNGSSATAYAETSTTQNFMDKLSGASSGASMFGTIICDILDYANTSKYKTTRSLGGTDQNGSGVIFFTSGVWQNTAAITSVKLSPFDGYSYVQYTQAALYGIKG